MKKHFGELNFPPCGEPDGIQRDAELLLALPGKEAAVKQAVSPEGEADGDGADGPSTEALLQRAAELHMERNRCRRLLALAKEHAEPKKLFVFSVILLVLCCFLFVVSLALLYESAVFSIVSASLAAASIALFVFALIRKRRARRGYAPLVSYYAEKTAALDLLLARYEKAIGNPTE